jgi:hypothetical protein
MEVRRCECGTAIPMQGTALDLAQCPNCHRFIGPVKATERIPLETHLRLTQRIPVGDRARLAYLLLGTLGLILAFGAAPVLSRIAAAALALALVAAGLSKRRWRSLPVIALGAIVVAIGEQAADHLAGLAACAMLGANYARTRYIDDLRAGRVAAAAGWACLALIAAGLVQEAPAVLDAAGAAVLAAAAALSILNRRSRLEAGDRAAWILGIGLLGTACLWTRALLADPETTAALLGQAALGFGAADDLLKSSFAKLDSGRLK